jgi:hypothetical protein
MVESWSEMFETIILPIHKKRKENVKKQGSLEQQYISVHFDIDEKSSYIKVTLKETKKDDHSHSHHDDSPLSTCHPYLPPTPKTLVFDDEISSIIAYTLQSRKYLDFLTFDKDLESMMKTEEKTEFKLAFKDIMEDKYIQMKKSGMDISCTCYYPKQFSALRYSFYKGEDDFLTSLSRCKPFLPTGGKSGSTFVKTWDDRLIIKQVSRVELNAFLESGTSYFEYMTKILYHEVIYIWI